MSIFWTSSPGILISRDNIRHMWPGRTMSYVDKLNAITRLAIVLAIVGYRMAGSIRALFAGLITVIGIVFIHSYYTKTGRRLFESVSDNDNDNESTDDKTEPSGTEGFSSNGNRGEKHISNVAELTTALKTNFSKTTPTNPLSNVLLTDIVDNPNKKSAPPAYQDKVYASINDNAKKMVKDINKDFPGIEDKLFGSLGENFDFDASMRQFHSTPNTRVSNNQDAFAQYCYGNMPSCKDGDVLMCSSSDSRYILP